MKSIIKNIAIIILIQQSNICHGQIINTIAGTGTGGYNGDGIPAASAQLFYPAGVFADASGNIYITDMSNACIRKINSSGVINTVAGTPGVAPSFFSGNGGPAVSATFSWYVLGAITDATGNLFIADAGSNIICKVNKTTGIINIYAGINGIAGASGDGGNSTSAKLNYPVAMAFDAVCNNLYIADCYNHKIRKVVISTGVITTVAGTGIAGPSGDGGIATAAKLNYPAGIAVDASGNIYIGDGGNNKVRKITVSTGIISTIAGTGSAGLTGDGGLATSAKLNAPQGIAVDASGNIYIADQANNRIRKIISGTGIISTFAGTTMGFWGDGGPANLAKLNAPWSLAVLGNNLYISDNVNNRIRIITGLGLPLSVELISFSGENKNNLNHLYWSTFGEVNNDYFDVEKSTNGSEFKKIGTVKGNGNSNQILNYGFVDTSPYYGPNYYRLKQVDFNGDIEYTFTIAVKSLHSVFSTTSYFIQNGILYINTLHSHCDQIELLSIEGKSLFYKKRKEDNTTIDMNSYSNGMYVLKIFDGENMQTLKLIKN